MGRDRGVHQGGRRDHADPQDHVLGPAPAGGATAMGPERRRRATGVRGRRGRLLEGQGSAGERRRRRLEQAADRKSTRLNSSHTVISYAVFCLKKKNRKNNFGGWPRHARLAQRDGAVVWLGESGEEPPKPDLLSAFDDVNSACVRQSPLRRLEQ